MEAHLDLSRIELQIAQKSHSALVLPYLTLPALETLLISDLDISRQDFLSFLKRSSPPLRSLSLSSEH
ncbi:hypothetical protein FB45DRAFT_1035389 [Roridomyces roridus]|uniref:Uncharacterized protein n=1 Tax=Roridomyces roridus TaxID=1738132 RepID=A0AAD7FC84_9AGAR|nr:hypothetical protein FB45DRAFT_1035389 [Roridomyces roridus]